MSKKKRLLWNIIPLVLFITILSGCLYFNDDNDSYSAQLDSKEVSTEDEKRLISLPEDDLVVVNLNVGHGDCAVLHAGNEYGIIDTGPEESKQIVTDFLDSNNINEIKFMLITHYDRDHIGNAVEILNNYNVETVFIPDYKSEKVLYKSLMEELKAVGDVRVISAESDYDWNDVNIHFYPAQNVENYTKDGVASDNDLSIVSVVSYYNNKLLFLGDVEKKRIKEMLNSGKNYKCDWVKMPHHGTEDKKIDKLIDAMQPEYAIVSCCKEDGFIGSENEQYLEQNNVEVFTTLDNNIITRCDGRGLNVMYADNGITDAVSKLFFLVSDKAL